MIMRHTSDRSIVRHSLIGGVAPPRPRIASLRVALLALALVAAVVAMASWATVARAEGRVALIIANSHYDGVSPLPNPEADSKLIEAALRQAGFDSVTVLRDLRRAPMQAALQAFGAQADKADVALLYYAGHGIEIDNVNYLIPIDAVFERDRDVDIEAIKLDTALTVTEGAKRLRMIILDACRDNPFLAKMKRSESTRAIAGGGMAAIEPTKNSLVVYSAKAGTTASDGVGNSPFAVALAKRIVEPGREISLLLRQIRDDVLDATGKRQEPFTYGSLSSQEFYFIPPTSMAKGPTDFELESWGLCRSGLTKGPCEAYIANYPNGRFTALARTRAADLLAKGTQVAAIDSGATARTTGPVTSGNRVSDLGITVAYDAAKQGILVQTVERNALVTGQLFPNDIIMKIDSIPADAGQPPANQLLASLRNEGRIKLLVKRGDATSVVIIRADN